MAVWFDDAWTKGPPDWQRLVTMAEAQGGFFVNADARACGCTRAVLSYHARRGTFVRVRRGLYRLPNHPPAPCERERIEWIAAGRERAVLTHESALRVLGYLPIPPRLVHVTVGWDRRWYRGPDGVKVHTRIDPWPEEEILGRRGMLVTIAERSFVEAAESRCPSEGLAEALRHAIEDGAVEPDRLLARARRRRPHRVLKRVAGLLDEGNRADEEDFMAELRRLAPPPT